MASFAPSAMGGEKMEVIPNGVGLIAGGISVFLLVWWFAAERVLVFRLFYGGVSLSAALFSGHRIADGLASGWIELPVNGLGFASRSVSPFGYWGGMVVLVGLIAYLGYLVFWAASAKREVIERRMAASRHRVRAGIGVLVFTLSVIAVVYWRSLDAS